MIHSLPKSKFFSFTVVLGALALTACSGGAPKSPTVSAGTSMNPNLKTTAISSATEKAIAKAEASGNTQEALALLAEAHSKNTDDAIVATRYGRALREDEQINAAIRTLTPHTKGESANIEAITEMAMAQIAVGDFKAAENYASVATEMNPKNARAYLALGTAQDALGRHQDAEVAFRQGFKHWKGDPTPIMNNLALNLASQGHLEESLSMLEKALSISPNRMDLERNRRIIATLVETSGPRAPTPSAKPEATEPASGEATDKQSAVVPQQAPKALTPTKKPAPQTITTAQPEATAEELNSSIKPAAQASTNIEIEENIDVVAAETESVDMVQTVTTVKNLKTRSGSSLNE